MPTRSQLHLSLAQETAVISKWPSNAPEFKPYCCMLAQSWLSLQPMDCGQTHCSVHGIFRQVYWSGLPFPSPPDLPDPGIELTFPASPALAGRLFTTEPPGKLILLSFKSMSYPEGNLWKYHIWVCHPHYPLHLIQVFPLLSTMDPFSYPFLLLQWSPLLFLSLTVLWKYSFTKTCPISRGIFLISY